jgi:hypothetical protein
MLVTPQGSPQIVFAALARVGTHGGVQLNQYGHPPASFTAPSLKVRQAVEALAAVIELFKESIQGSLRIRNGTTKAPEMAVNGFNDCLHPPTRLFLFVAVWRHLTQCAAHGLPVKFQYVSRAERGNQFHV